MPLFCVNHYGIANIYQLHNNVNIGDSMATVSIVDNDGEAYIILTCAVISLCMVCTVIIIYV